jgi:HEAT repeat protein
VNKRAIIALVVLLVLASAASTSYFLRFGEPVYQGKKVSQWFAEIDYKGNGVAHNDPGVQALVAMGKDAVPYLTEQFSLRDSRLRKFVAATLQKVPLIKVRPMSESERHLRAYVPLMLMGPKAEQAVPQLLRLIQTTNFQSRLDAFQLLGYIHSQPELAIPVLMPFLEDSEKNRRLFAISALGKYGESAAVATPRLRPFLRSEDQETRMRAAIALVGIGDLIDLALPVIGSILNDPSAPNRYGLLLLHLLGELGEKARATVPLLVEASKNESSPVRSEVLSTLKRIDPNAAAEAGVK